MNPFPDRTRFVLAAQQEESPVPSGGDLERLLQQLAEGPWIGAAIFVVASLVLLLWGWRLAVFAVMLATAAGLAALAWMTQPLIGDTVAIVLAVIAALFGLWLGRYVHRAGGAIYGAAFLGALGFVLGSLSGYPTAALGIGVLAAVVGLVLGWRLARHLDAIGSALLGAQFLGVGLYGLLGARMEAVAPWVAFGAGLLAFLLGTAYQFRDIGRRRIKKAARHARREAADDERIGNR